VARRSADDLRTGGPGTPLAGAPVFLILTGDARNADLAGWRRGRSVLLCVDKKLAKARAACRVRALPGGDEPLKNQLRPAGRMSRRDLKRPARAPDFARALGAIRAAMTRDLAALARSGLRASRPTAVFYAAEPPLADAITAEEYEKLATQASILWIVPEASAALMSPRFAGEGARILTDHCAVTDEVSHLLLFRDREDVAAPGLPGEVGGLVQPRQLSRVPEQEDAGDPAVLHDEAHRGPRG
jgi:hypothetical protein